MIHFKIEGLFIVGQRAILVRTQMRSLHTLQLYICNNHCFNKHVLLSRREALFKITFALFMSQGRIQWGPKGPRPPIFRRPTKSVLPLKVSKRIRKLCPTDAWKSHLSASRIQTFLGEPPPDPPPRISRLRHDQLWPAAECYSLGPLFLKSWNRPCVK